MYNIFVDSPKKIITPSPYIQEVLEQHGAKCHECGSDLGVGDYLDNFFPYFDENNICKSCLEEGI